jgi:hypothetical protein
MIRSENLGKKGEARFMELCAEIGITCNPSIHDAAGWDYLLNFSPEAQASVPLDDRPPGISCYVQVKTILVSSTSVKLTVAMAERLAKYPAPAFICIFVVTRELQFESVFLLHVTNERLALILKRLRMAEAKGKSGNLNKQAISFHPLPSEKIELTGASLGKRIEEHVGGDLDSYIFKKKELREKLGFDERPYSFKVQFDNNDPDVILDALVGRAKMVPAELSEMFVKRFNISLPFGTPGAAKISISVPVADQCKFSYVEKAGVVPAILIGAVRFAPEVAGIKRIYIEFGSLTCIVDSRKDGRKLSFVESGVDKALAIDEHIATARICGGLQERSGVLEITFLSSQTTTKLRMSELIVDGNTMRGHRYSEGIVEGWRALGRICEFAGSVPAPEFTYSDMVKVHNNILFFDALLRGSTPQITVSSEKSGQTITIEDGPNILPFSFIIDRYLVAAYGTVLVVPSDGAESDLPVFTTFSLKEIRLLRPEQEQLKSFVNGAKLSEDMQNVIVLPNILSFPL